MGKRFIVETDDEGRMTMREASPPDNTPMGPFFRFIFFLLLGGLITGIFGIFNTIIGGPYQTEALIVFMIMSFGLSFIIFYGKKFVRGIGNYRARRKKKI